MTALYEPTIKSTPSAEDFPPIFSILGKELAPKFYQGQPVITLSDVDYLHERPEGTARRNFNEHKSKLNPKEDFIELNQPYEIRTVGVTRPQGGTPVSVILLTESGYLMLVKSFTDDLAWDIQRVLVKSYFRFKELWMEKQLQRLRDMQTSGLLVEYHARIGDIVWQIHDRYGKAIVCGEQIIAPVIDCYGAPLKYQATYKGRLSGAKRHIWDYQFGITAFTSERAALYVAAAMRDGIEVDGVYYEGDGSDRTAQAAARAYYAAHPEAQNAAVADDDDDIAGGIVDDR